MSRLKNLNKAINRRQQYRDGIVTTLSTISMFRREGVYAPKGMVDHLKYMDNMLENEIGLLKHEVNILFLGGAGEKEKSV